MTRREKCKNTDLPRDFCSHCLKPVTSQSSNYELRFSFEGVPIVEVLKDGGPIHAYDRHFKFGLEKAKLLLAALHEIEQFAHGVSVVTRSMPLEGRTIKIQVLKKPDFIHSSGKTISNPWLAIDTLPISSGASIGVGVEKAKAICAVAEKLRRWVSRVGSLPT
jgi:hypothetical protein